ncbi:MAG: hypothetical protein KKD63_01595 [Proteobacteria bacterium]|nr:hypothetical protein [Desulfobulbaceae bacterium]MBU4151556.1 hypothetical protein [Pseudomonadota bacterium]MDP2104735.1 hypothetical protein [Desulfobulbaceae bacterium]
MICSPLERLEKIFDSVEAAIESHAAHRVVGALLVSSFVGTLVAIYLKRHGFLPPLVEGFVPGSYLMAIQLAFTLLLFVEVIALILAISHSISSSVGKQFELLSLIFLRDVFKEVAHLGEPIIWDKVAPAVSTMAASAIGALGIFMVVAFFYRAQCRRPITHDHLEQNTFIAAKKCIALVLLGAFFFIVGRSLMGAYTGTHLTSPFESLYTLLIYTDVLLVLLSLRYSSSYHVAFRNSGFAVATVMIRIALIAPPLIGVGLGAATSLFALATTLAYNRFAVIMAEPCNIS